MQDMLEGFIFYSPERGQTYFQRSLKFFFKHCHLPHEDYVSAAAQGRRQRPWHSPTARRAPHADDGQMARISYLFDRPCATSRSQGRVIGIVQSCSDNPRFGSHVVLSVTPQRVHVASLHTVQGRTTELKLRVLWLQHRAWRR